MTRGGLSDEARFELSMAAAGRERANRPRALVAGAVLVLVVAAVLAIWGVVARAAANRTYANRLAEQTRVEQMLAEFGNLERQERGGGGATPPGERIGDLYSRMENLAARAGLKDKPQPPRETPQTRGQVRVVEYYYPAVRDPSLKALLEWLRLAAAEIPGMEVFGVTLKPDPTNWTMTVTFRRWERAQ